MKILLTLFMLMFSLSCFAQEYIGADGPTFKTDESLKDAPRATGLILPKDWGTKDAVKLPYLYQGDLPSKFDWREVRGLTPIRNQGSCGSCWSFSAMATMADVLHLHGVGSFDLSEQYYVDCDRNSYGCSGGWYHNVFQMLKGDGVVMESDYPYKARDMRCPSDMKHHYEIIDFSELSSGVADTETIKRAIYTYGPLSVAVAVKGKFGSYSSGIYNESTSGTVNHAVNLVGWNDDVTPRHWIMRNSWGSSWGENGYMRIAYGSRKIGYAATYIDYNGPVPHDGPEPTPTPEPTPDPCPPCPECTFWEWISNIF